jgi:hypothetical protein
MKAKLVLMVGIVGRFKSDGRGVILGEDREARGSLARGSAINVDDAFRRACDLPPAFVHVRIRQLSSVPSPG